MDQILFNLMSGKYKSIWDLMQNCPIIFEKNKWEMILTNLIKLFRKDSFENLVKNELYYPQPTQNCRYYLKPNNGSNGKNIKIINNNNITIEDHILCPEIITPLMRTQNGLCKYDYRIWIGIKNNLDFYICHTMIKRVSLIPFDLNSENGSLTNTSLYSEQFNCNNLEIYEKVFRIVKDILKKLTPDQENKNKVMLTGWDFIENEHNELFVLEVNCNPGLNIQHMEVLTEFLNWINN